MRAIAAATLRFAGHQAETAADGRQALEKVERTRPDLLLLDLTMPEMDGFEVLERLRTQGGGRPPMPVLVFSSRDDTETRLRVAELGACGFVSKGATDLDSLRAQVSAHL
jgi:two-component system OmpR family response regulator